uniref:Uncharacterized protein n=1 Tax=Mus musculus TaxID=10090 RepID=Q8CBF4_MOUSE|nr:unnamed protein product [Mus musculus]
MLPFTTSQSREGWKPPQGHAARTRASLPSKSQLLPPYHDPPTSPPPQRCPGDQKGGREEGASLIEMHCGLRTGTWRDALQESGAVRRGLRPGAHVGARETGLLPRNPLPRASR